jgi:hypothetical protein
LNLDPEITLYVEHTEPALRVTLGGEVTVEFLQERVPTPMPELPALLVPAEAAAPPAAGGAGVGVYIGTGNVIGATATGAVALHAQTAEERAATIRASWLRRMASEFKDKGI